MSEPGLCFNIRRPHALRHESCAHARGGRTRSPRSLGADRSATSWHGPGATPQRRHGSRIVSAPDLYSCAGSGGMVVVTPANQFICPTSGCPRRFCTPSGRRKSCRRTWSGCRATGWTGQRVCLIKSGHELVRLGLRSIRAVKPSWHRPEPRPGAVGLCFRERCGYQGSWQPVLRRGGISAGESRRR